MLLSKNNKILISFEMSDYFEQEDMLNIYRLNMPFFTNAYHPVMIGIFISYRTFAVVPLTLRMFIKQKLRRHLANQLKHSLLAYRLLLYSFLPASNLLIIPLITAIAATAKTTSAVNCA